MLGGSSLVMEHPLAVDTPAMSLSTSVPDISGQLEADSKLDSQNQTASTTHGACLSLSDHDRIRIFVHEFIVRGLLPWAERQLRLLNDQVSHTQ